jgi:ssDNA-binding Zn-finger/Zn-ribbon topoisomerase 1
MANVENKKLVCKDCNSEFEFAAGEQLFYTERQFPDPVRCTVCRKAKKSKQEKHQTASI